MLIIDEDKMIDICAKHPIDHRLIKFPLDIPTPASLVPFLLTSLSLPLPPTFQLSWATSGPVCPLLHTAVLHPPQNDIQAARRRVGFRAAAPDLARRGSARREPVRNSSDLGASVGARAVCLDCSAASRRRYQTLERLRRQPRALAERRWSSSRRPVDETRRQRQIKHGRHAGSHGEQPSLARAIYVKM